MGDELGSFEGMNDGERLAISTPFVAISPSLVKWMVNAR
jgi:hypothetical protein